MSGIRHAKDTPSHSSKKIFTTVVIIDFGAGGMYHAGDFYNEMRRYTRKIRDEGTNRMLSTKACPFHATAT